MSNSTFDPQIGNLGERWRPDAKTMGMVTAGIVGILVLITLAFILGGVTSSTVSSSGRQNAPILSSPLLTAEELVDVQEQVRFRAQVRAFLGQLRTLKLNTNNSGDTIVGLDELIAQMEDLLATMDPLGRSS